MAKNKLAYASALQKHLDKIQAECQGISNLAAIHDVKPEYVKATEEALKALTRSVVKDLKAKKETVTVDLSALIGEQGEQDDSIDSDVDDPDEDDTANDNYGSAVDVDKAAS